MHSSTPLGSCLSQLDLDPLDLDLDPLDLMCLTLMISLVAAVCRVLSVNPVLCWSMLYLLSSKHIAWEEISLLWKGMGLPALIQLLCLRLLDHLGTSVVLISLDLVSSTTTEGPGEMPAIWGYLSRSYFGFDKLDLDNNQLPTYCKACNLITRPLLEVDPLSKRIDQRVLNASQNRLGSLLVSSLTILARKPHLFVTP